MDTRDGFIDLTPKALPDSKEPIKARLYKVAEKIGGFVREIVGVESRDPIRNRRTALAVLAGVVALTGIGVVGSAIGDESCQTFDQSLFGYNPSEAATGLDAVLESNGVETEYQALHEGFSDSGEIEVCADPGLIEEILDGLEKPS